VEPGQSDLAELLFKNIVKLHRQGFADCQKWGYGRIIEASNICHDLDTEDIKKDALVQRQANHAQQKDFNKFIRSLNTVSSMKAKPGEKKKEHAPRLPRHMCTNPNYKK